MDRTAELMVKFKKLHESAVLPKPAHGWDSDAGMDLTTVEDVVLRPMVPTLAPCGFAMQLPSGIEGQIRPRSGMALKEGVSVWNAPGTIDPSYRGEVKVMLIWTGHDGSAEKIIRAGTRVAQLVLSIYISVNGEYGWSDELDDSNRGEGGFGSTGV